LFLENRLDRFNDAIGVEDWSANPEHFVRVRLPVESPHRTDRTGPDEQGGRGVGTLFCRHSEFRLDIVFFVCVCGQE